MAPPMLIIWADGIGSARVAPDDGRSILLTVVTRLAEKLREQGRQVVPTRVTWPASMAGVGGPKSWDAAAREGVEDIDRILRANPGREVVLLGYSGGCKVIHDWLGAQPARGLERVRAVGLLSDPFRPATRYQHDTPDPGGYGIAGARLGPIAGRTFWTSYGADVISSCPPDSPLRTVADLSDKIPGSFVDDLGDHLRLNNWQLANYMRLWRKDPLAYINSFLPRMGAARDGVVGYLLGGAHTEAYTRAYSTPGRPFDRRSLAHRLADTISWALR